VLLFMITVRWGRVSGWGGQQQPVWQQLDSSQQSSTGLTS
jgi:hypothetical protein